MTVTNRRDFLKLSQASLFALALPGLPAGLVRRTNDWPTLRLTDLPTQIRQIMALVPAVALDAQGYAYTPNAQGQPSYLPVATTQWNRERRYITDRLDGRFPWGIVLHWFGDGPNFERSLAGYLRGFDSLRSIGGVMGRTSAHFLVGDEPPGVYAGEPEPPISIIQTQTPDTDGTPYLGSHVRSLDINAHRNREQYFVRAYYQLGYADSRIHSLLQDMFDGRYVEPNTRTLAVEMTGQDFDGPGSFPPRQLIANTVGLVCALMLRYNIPAENVLGHHEIQLGKSDPGKKFMALMRLLIGVKALLDNNLPLRELVFGLFLTGGEDPARAVGDYFKLGRDYLALVSTGTQVYEWETTCNYWLFADRYSESPWQGGFVRNLVPPLAGEVLRVGDRFLVPSNHEGMDLFNGPSGAGAPLQARLVAPGQCLYTGPGNASHTGQIAIFRHRQPDGAEVLSTYNHLNHLSALESGQYYPVGTPVGEVTAGGDQAFLHFAVAFGATWDTDLRQNPNVPSNAGPGWIRRRYTDPLPYLNNRLDPAFPHLSET